MDVKRKDDCRLIIPKQGRMRTEGLVFADMESLRSIREDGSLQQVANVATLPGIVGRSMAMPDIHQGYGFPIGGVAAFNMNEGIVSPGGVGYDINCGVRLLLSSQHEDDARGRIKDITSLLFSEIPSGVGSRRNDLGIGSKDLKKVLSTGFEWARKKGFAFDEDRNCIEDGGTLKGANPDFVSSKALERGRNQLGTLGSGNHFIEIQKVDEVFNADAADAFGIFPGQITVMVHSGSRGLGHQVCTDYIKTFSKAMPGYGIQVPDRQLVCAPVRSEEGRHYVSAMKAAANYAYCNRQVMSFFVRDVWDRLFPGSGNLSLLYDVCHNIAKFETHEVDGKQEKLCVHRKGATRAWPAGHQELTGTFHEFGQPVLLPGDMGRYSFVLLPTARTMKETFGSAGHGAGRRLGRSQALKKADFGAIMQDLENKGITVMAQSRRTIKEEYSAAYKDAARVVDLLECAGLCETLIRLKPLGVIKG